MSVLQEIKLSRNQNKAFLDFVSRVSAIASKYSAEDISEFVRTGKQRWPEMVPLLQAYFKLAQNAETNVLFRGSSRQSGRLGESEAPHLFDLLRSKKLFPTNGELAEFAGRILPGLERRRFDKMSRGDIAARIVEYLETLTLARRRELENSMREAFVTSATERRKRKDSFFSKWEKIIKGVEI